MGTKTDVFKAIADPRRRQIIQMLIVSSTLSLHAITDGFSMSRQALTRHIDVLQDAGILKTEKKGRETYFSLEVKPLKEVYDWVKHYQAFWEEKLENLDQLIKETEK